MTAARSSPISPQEVALLEPVCCRLHGILDAVEIGTVPNGHVETPVLGDGRDFNMGDILSAGSASKFSKGYQLQILRRDHRDDHRMTPYKTGDNSDSADDVPMVLCRGLATK